MKVVGITGGIGSGKSTVALILEKRFHAFLIYTDKIAHMLMRKGMISYNLIVEYFGEQVLDSDGEIDRKLLGSIVYQDPNKLIHLNSLTHPYVMDYVKNLIKLKQDENVELICVETALPIEAGLKEFCDEIWYVYAPENLRRERLQKSRNITIEKLNDIFKNQIGDELYRDISTHTIQNDSDEEKIIRQIEVLLENSVES
jgi:dephospho-CoA kinase